MLEVWDPSGAPSSFAKRPGFPGAHGGLVSTADDYLAFAQMMINNGKVGSRQVLSAKSVAAMMTDQIPADVKTRSPFSPGFWEARGRGYGGSVITKHDPSEPRGFGWDGGYGTCAYWDVRNGVTVIFPSQRLVGSPTYSEVFHRSFDGVYAAAGV